MPTTDSGYLGEIFLFGGGFAPAGSALCQGQLISISAFPALFAILGTTYGGDGMTNFGLPDLRGRAPIGSGTGPGLTSKALGSDGGAETQTLDTTQLPSHSHTLKASPDAGTTNAPEGNILGNAGFFDNEFNDATGSALVNMNSNAIASTGGGQPFSIRSPYLTINFCILVNGVFPSQN